MTAELRLQTALLLKWGVLCLPDGKLRAPGGAVSHTWRNPAGIACLGSSKATTRMTNHSNPLREE